ncbi:MAG: Ig-like domain-containing protein [Muribaculaceae bacterium]|nr:Ig-like domain-containing protein [Muribaculaceae bacterium]
MTKTHTSLLLAGVLALSAAQSLAANYPSEYTVDGLRYDIYEDYAVFKGVTSYYDYVDGYILVVPDSVYRYPVTGFDIRSSYKDMTEIKFGANVEWANFETYTWATYLNFDDAKSLTSVKGSDGQWLVKYLKLPPSITTFKMSIGGDWPDKLATVEMASYDQLYTLENDQLSGGYTLIIDGKPLPEYLEVDTLMTFNFRGNYDIKEVKFLDATYRGRIRCDFAECGNLERVTLPEGLKDLQSHAFYNCKSLKDITLPNGLKTLNNRRHWEDYDGRTFTECSSLKSISIPNSVINGLKSTFSGCTALEEVELGRNIEYLDGTFYGCKALRSIKMNGLTPPEIYSPNSTFDSEVFESATLYVPEGSLAAYRNHEQWGRFADIREYAPTTNIDIKFDKDTYNYLHGSTLPLSFTVIDPYDEGYEPEVVKWSSSDESVATVDKDGVVKALGLGSTTITVQVYDKVATTTVHVVPNIVVSDCYVTLAKGSDAPILFTISPASPEAAVVIDVDDPTVATAEVSAQTATVHALKPGSTKARIYLAEAPEFATELCFTVFDPDNIAELGDFGFDRTTYYTYLGSGFELPVNGAPYGARWSSSDPSVLAVDVHGNITLLSPGTTTIKATALTPTGDGPTAEATVEVYAVPAKSIGFLQPEAYIAGNIEPMPTAIVYPEGACQKVKWSPWESYADLVEFFDDGTFRLAPEVLVFHFYAETLDGSGVKETVILNVEEQKVEIIGNPLMLYNESRRLKSYVHPRSRYSDVCTWTVTGDGSITGDSPNPSSEILVKSNGKIGGRIYVTATSVDNPELSETFVLKIGQPAIKNITLSQTNLSLRAGETVGLYATVTPSDANRDLWWTVTSSDYEGLVHGVATGGSITGVQPGIGVVVAADPDTGVFGFCNLTVSRGDNIFIAPSYLPVQEVIAEGESVRINATEGGQRSDLGWQVQDLKIAGFDSYPYGSSVAVKGVKKGTTTLRAAAANSTGAPMTCKLIVVPADKVYSLSFKSENHVGKVGDSFKPEVSILPRTMAGHTLTWSTDDPAVATVSADGTVRIVGNGSCTITATTTDGSEKSASMRVTTAASIGLVYTEDGERHDVYTTAGILVCANASKEEFSALPAGTYVIKGCVIFKK